MKLAVYFPGVGYHCDKPLLYYARKIAAACGFDQHITLSYTTQIYAACRDLCFSSPEWNRLYRNCRSLG